MAIYLYNEDNPHPGGFLGYRVAVMVDTIHFQFYYAFSMYGAAAEHLAEEKEADLLALQEIAKKEKSRSLLPLTKPSARYLLIAKNLQIGPKQLGGRKGKQSLCFIIQRPGGRGSRTVSVTRGLTTAWKTVLEKYTDLYPLTPDELKTLNALKPTMGDILHYLNNLPADYKAKFRMFDIWYDYEGMVEKEKLFLNIK